VYAKPQPQTPFFLKKNGTSMRRPLPSHSETALRAGRAFTRLFSASHGSPDSRWSEERARADQREDTCRLDTPCCPDTRHEVTAPRVAGPSGRTEILRAFGSQDAAQIVDLSEMPSKMAIQVDQEGLRRHRDIENNLGILPLQLFRGEPLDDRWNGGSLPWC